jgi:hypothetical protein
LLHPCHPLEGETYAMRRPVDVLTAARAEALFTSNLSTGCSPTSIQVAVAIRRGVLTHGGSRGCAAQLASAYGDYPETAAPRMRWALTVIRNLYRRSPPECQSVRPAVAGPSPR